MDFHEIIRVFSIIILTISISSCMWFQFWYMRLIRKTMALKMIAILNLSNLVFHGSSIFTMIFPEDFQGIPTLISTSSLGFSIIWISSVAFFVYNSLTKDKIVNQEKYFRWSLFILTSFSNTVSIV